MILNISMTHFILIMLDIFSSMCEQNSSLVNLLPVWSDCSVNTKDNVQLRIPSAKTVEQPHTGRTCVPLYLLTTESVCSPTIT